MPVTPPRIKWGLWLGGCPLGKGVVWGGAPQNEAQGGCPPSGPRKTHKHKGISSGNGVRHFTGGSRPQGRLPRLMSDGFGLFLFDAPGSGEDSFMCHSFMYLFGALPQGRRVKNHMDCVQKPYEIIWFRPWLCHPFCVFFGRQRPFRAQASTISGADSSK